MFYIVRIVRIQKVGSRYFSSLPCFTWNVKSLRVIARHYAGHPLVYALRRPPAHPRTPQCPPAHGARGAGSLRQFPLGLGRHVGRRYPGADRFRVRRPAGFAFPRPRFPYRRRVRFPVSHGITRASAASMQTGEPRHTSCDRRTAPHRGHRRPSRTAFHFRLRSRRHSGVRWQVPSAEVVSFPQISHRVTG